MNSKKKNCSKKQKSPILSNYQKNELSQNSMEKNEKYRRKVTKKRKFCQTIAKNTSTNFNRLF